MRSTCARGDRAQSRGVTWKFILFPEPIQNLGIVFAEDRYEGYARERTEILDFIKSNGIKNAVSITTDLHGIIVNNLTYQQQPGGPQISTDMFEAIAGPDPDAAVACVLFCPKLGP